MTLKKPYVSTGMIPSLFIQGSCFLVHMLKTAGSRTSSYANQLPQPYSFKIQTQLNDTRFHLNAVFSQVFFFLTISYYLNNLRLKICSLGLIFLHTDRCLLALDNSRRAVRQLCMEMSVTGLQEFQKQFRWWKRPPSNPSKRHSTQCKVTTNQSRNQMVSTIAILPCVQKQYTKK